MHLPNYRDGSLVNLMQSLLTGLGATGAGDGAHGHLSSLGPDEIADARHVVLVVVDGLGQAQLDSGPAPALGASLRGTMTSVFPSTTASAVTTLLTGLAPVEHGMTGWYMWLRELKSVIAPLPFTTRAGGTSLTELGVEPDDIFIAPTVFERVRADCHAVQPADLVDSRYSRAHTRGAASTGFRRLGELVDCIVDIVGNARERTYVSAYWPVLDTLSHRFGAASSRTRRHLAAIDAHFERLRAALTGSGTLLVLTADHWIRRRASRDTARCGVRSGSGSDALAPPVRRAAGRLLLRARRTPRGIRAMDGRRAGPAPAMSSRAASMVEDGWFGLADPHPRLLERVGDFALVMRDDYAIADRLAGEKPFRQIGVHGGRQPRRDAGAAGRGSRELIRPAGAGPRRS